MLMPKFRYLALATAGIMVLSLPASAAYAASARSTASKPVLTVGKKGGPAVKKHATLTASLARRASVTVALGSLVTVTCRSSTLTAKVTANPSRPGKATLSVTGWSIRKCPKMVSGVTLNSLTAINLPYRATVSDAKGDPVTVAGSRKSKPVGFKAVVTAAGTTVTCVFTAAKVSGHAANTGNKVSFKGQPFALDASASSMLCSQAGVSTATFSATYGPVLDTSLRHHPKVFVS
jgi:hypothetical protein